MREEGRHLTDVLASLEESPSEPGPVVAGTRDPHDKLGAVLSQPLGHRVVAAAVVDELAHPDRPPEVIEHRYRERALVRIHPYRHTHPGLLSSADLRCDQREDTQALGQATLLSSHYR
jgi:hypothetical protein